MHLSPCLSSVSPTIAAFGLSSMQTPRTHAHMYKVMAFNASASFLSMSRAYTDVSSPSRPGSSPSSPQAVNPSPVSSALIASKTGLFPDPAFKMVPSSMHCESCASRRRLCPVVRNSSSDSVSTDPAHAYDRRVVDADAP